MDEKKWGALLAAAVLAVGGLVYYQAHRPAPAPVESAPVAEAAPPAAPAPADYPVPPPAPDAPPLPQLADSDTAFRAALDALAGNAPLEAFLMPDMLIRRLVATIDNLPRDRAAPALMPVKRTPPPFLVDESGGRTVIAARNAERYQSLVLLFGAIDAARLVDLYFRWYPLFQRAYVDLGYPGRSFNNRLVEVIDHLLATPEAPPEVELLRPKLAWEFADPRLERLSAGQKTLLRLGPAQRAEVLRQLRAIRAALVARAAPAP